MDVFKELETDLEKATCLQNILISRATGGAPDSGTYELLRKILLDNAQTKPLLPDFVKTNRDLDQFWQFIKYEFETYKERRTCIYTAFQPLLDLLEGKTAAPPDSSISQMLKSFDEDGVHSVWEKALARRVADPEGAITAARTLLETVCKHILDEQGVEYAVNKIEMHELYKLVSKELNLSANQHSEDVFKQILGGCSAVVNGLGTLRNRLGDSHGQGKKRPARPSSRHAELAVNLAGSMALFLISTWIEQQQ